MLRNCNICDKEYEAESRYLNRGQGFTCSKACGTILAQRNRPVKSRPETNLACAWCGVKFYRKPGLLNSKSGNYYCSREHQGFGRNALLHFSGPNPRNPITEGLVKKYYPSGKAYWMKPCAICTGPFNSKRFDTCIKCRRGNPLNDWLSGNNNASLLFSKTTGLPSQTKNFVKKYLLQVRGDHCEKCGFDTHGPFGSIIQMDHINGDCFDNRLENLQLLCPNCHAMTDNYGSRNKNSSRAHRRRVKHQRD